MIKPIGSRVLLQVVEPEEKTAFGLYIASSAQEKPQEATVVATGDGEISHLLTVGVKVIFAKYAGTEVKFEGVNYLLIEQKDILAVIG